MKAGREREALAWAEKHKLYFPIEGALTLPAPKAASPTSSTNVPGNVGNAAPQGVFAASTPNEAQGPSLPAVQASLTAAYSGGAGVDGNGLAQNLDHSGRIGQNSQSVDQGVSGGKAGVLASSTLGSAPDGASPASPSGEVEGNKEICQADKTGLFSNRLENGGWVVSGEGVVGKACRNRWFVEVCVGGQWAKAAVGENVVRNGQRVRVRLEWVSGDGRDAEYAIVDVLPDLEEPQQAKPIGFQHQNAREVPLEPKAEVVEMAEATSQGLADEEPTEAEAASEGADDFLERARRDAMRAFYGV